MISPNLDAIAQATRDLLLAIGEPHPPREGILETPARVAKFWDELLSTSN
mgnify:CR=1 FL=1